MTLFQVRMDATEVRRKLKRLASERFPAMREEVADILVREVPTFVEEQIKGGKLGLPSPQPHIISRKIRKGSPKPHVPLYDTGGYAESWQASKTSRNNRGSHQVLVGVTPHGANARGIPYKRLAGILHFGYSGQLPRPHIHTLRDKIIAKGKGLYRAKVMDVLRNS